MLIVTPLDRPRRLAGRATVRAAMRIGLVVAILVGVIGMHGLAAPAGAGHAATLTAAAPSPTDHGTDHDTGHGDSECPAPCDDSGHPGPMCQSDAVAGAVSVTADGTLPGAAVVAPVSIMGTSVDTGDGTGCGPPSRSELSIWRT